MKTPTPVDYPDLAGEIDFQHDFCFYYPSLRYCHFWFYCNHPFPALQSCHVTLGHLIKHTGHLLIASPLLKQSSLPGIWLHACSTFGCYSGWKDISLEKSSWNFLLSSPVVPCSCVSQSRRLLFICVSSSRSNLWSWALIADMLVCMWGLAKELACKRWLMNDSAVCRGRVDRKLDKWKNKMERFSLHEWHETLVVAN